VALLVGGVDNGKNYVLYHADPSGTYVRYEAKAIGSGSEGAQSLLQEKYSKDLSLQDALTLAVTVLKQVSAAPHAWTLGIYTFPESMTSVCTL
jgi:20S proteasome subunit alpha 5